MTQRRIDMFFGLILVVGIASYSWVYHFSNDESVASTLPETILTEVHTLSGLKVDESEFTATAMSFPYNHLTVNGETWFTQSETGFDSTQTLFELPAVPEDAWYSSASLTKFFDVSAHWESLKTQFDSLFAESSPE